MTVEELGLMGLTDATLESEFRKNFGRAVTIPHGNAPSATARRREVFDALCKVWYAGGSTGAAT